MRLRAKYILTGLLIAVLMLQSCGVNSNLMFKEVKGDDSQVIYITDSIPMTPVEDYRISPDDRISFTMGTNDGTEIVEKMSGLSEQRNTVTNANGLEYTVRRDGKVELPVVGKVMAAGLTIEQLEDTLQMYFAKEYKRPFVQVRVTNQRVIVFPGNGSDAQVVPLQNANTTLMEALAKAGGITDRGRASRIKLMRRVNGQRVVYGIDLSTMKGLRQVDMIVQANDYIYVEPTPQLAKEISANVVPVISLLSSAIFIVSAINLLK